MYFPRNSSSFSSSQGSFTILPWTGEGSGYMVGDGVCFSTFNYGTGSFIPIKNLNTRFDFKKNEKFYIDLSLAANLQVTGATINCSTVGPESPFEDKNNPKTWISYPDMMYIQPPDQYDENGRVKVIAEGKRQVKCYVLIGYRSDDNFKNNTFTSEGSVELGGGEGTPVQILTTDIILLASMYSGVPVIFPVPYFNGLTHYYASRDLELNSSSSINSTNSDSGPDSGPGLDPITGPDSGPGL
jgi:hypothetical protein